jgi:hypothetical protein
VVAGTAPLTLAPLDFEEALRDLLQVPPPPKGEDEPEREQSKRGRKRKQADEQKG